MIITLKAKLIRGMNYRNEWEGEIELDETATLVGLHDAIQKAVNFDDDHTFCFYVSRTARSRDRTYFDDENELLFTTTVKDMFPLASKQSLFYLFDWGDNWVFKISKTRKRPQEAAEGVTYPRMVKEKGVKPEQYL